MDPSQNHNVNVAESERIRLAPILGAGGAVLVAGLAAWAAYAPVMFMETLRAGWMACFG